MNQIDKKPFIWVEAYRPRNIDDCILPQSTKDTFNEFLKKGQIPNLLLYGTAGIGKTTVAKALCEQLGADYILINGSDEGRLKILHRPYHYLADQNTKSSLLTKLTTQPQMYNSLYGQTLRHFMVTVGLFSPVTTKTNSSNPCTPGVQWLTFPSQEKKRNNWQEPSTTVSGLYLRKKAYNMIQRFFPKSS
jgi:hypothetical protein